jgi:phosphoesterase RecJ-like protein
VFAALDSPSIERLGNAGPVARGTGRVIVIDHHPDAVPGGDVALIDPATAATGVLIWRLLDYLGVTPDAAIATCLYTALVTDTGRFSYSNTTPEALRVGADMVAAGAVPADIHTAVYESRSVGAQLLIGRVLARTVLASGGRTAYSWIEEADLAETGARPEETENLIDHVRALGGVEAVLLAKVHGGTVRGSLRAKGSFDVGAVARRFGGGGHRAAAGFTYDGDLPALLGAILPMLPGGSR